MVFSSVVFLFLFLPLTLIIHYFLDPRYRNIFLLAASLLFYSWGEGALTLLIVVSIFFNYLGGLLIGHLRGGGDPAARSVLALFICANVAVLVYFKYFNFLVGTLQTVGLFRGWLFPPIHLPIGISFYTFHILSYLIDVYRRDATPQKDPLDLGLYIFLFPQLVAGPIIRYKDISQKIASRFILAAGFWLGVERFIRGLAKKMIVANAVAVIADDVFGTDPSQLPASVAWLGLLAYTLQIYFDFSGYSDMAIGIGRMLGFQFPENFNYPYIAVSIRDFWQRWHISLSTWFRDYVYIPLGGNRNGTLSTYRNLFAVFFITGLWHGASWTFVAWGLFHGCFLALERSAWGGKLRSLPLAMQHAYALLVVMLAWVFFRCDTIRHAAGFFAALFSGSGSNYHALVHLDPYTIAILFAGIVLSAPLRKWLMNDETILAGERTWSPRSPGFAAITAGAYLALFVYCATLLAMSSYNPFIYFRF